MGNRHHKYVFAKDQPVRLQGDKIVYEDFKKSYEQMEFDSRFIENLLHQNPTLAARIMQFFPSARRTYEDYLEMIFYLKSYDHRMQHNEYAKYNAPNTSLLDRFFLLIIKQPKYEALQRITINIDQMQDLLLEMMRLFMPNPQKGFIKKLLEFIQLRDVQQITIKQYSRYLKLHLPQIQKHLDDYFTEKFKFLVKDGYLLKDFRSQILYEDAVLLSMQLAELTSPSTILLYEPTTFGSSFTAMQKNLIGYTGPWLLVIEHTQKSLTNDKQQIVYRLGAFQNGPILDVAGFQGDVQGFLFTIEPKIKFFLPNNQSRNFFYINNMQDKFSGSRQGLGFGGDDHKQNFKLWIDQDIDKSTVYNGYDPTYGFGSLITAGTTQLNITKLQIWGLGTQQDQLNQQDYWQNRNIEIENRRKVNKAEFLQGGAPGMLFQKTFAHREQVYGEIQKPNRQTNQNQRQNQREFNYNENIAKTFRETNLKSRNNQLQYGLNGPGTNYPKKDQQKRGQTSNEAQNMSFGANQTNRDQYTPTFNTSSQSQQRNLRYQQNMPQQNLNSTVSANINNNLANNQQISNQNLSFNSGRSNNTYNQSGTQTDSWLKKQESMQQSSQHSYNGQTPPRTNTNYNSFNTNSPNQYNINNNQQTLSQQQNQLFYSNQSQQVTSKQSQTNPYQANNYSQTNQSQQAEAISKLKQQPDYNSRGESTQPPPQQKNVIPREYRKVQMTLAQLEERGLYNSQLQKLRSFHEQWFQQGPQKQQNQNQKQQNMSQLQSQTQWQPQKQFYNQNNYHQKTYGQPVFQQQNQQSQQNRESNKQNPQYTLYGERKYNTNYSKQFSRPEEQKFDSTSLTSANLIQIPPNTSKNYTQYNDTSSSKINTHANSKDNIHIYADTDAESSRSRRSTVNTDDINQQQSSSSQYTPKNATTTSSNKYNWLDSLDYKYKSNNNNFNYSANDQQKSNMYSPSAQYNYRESINSDTKLGSNQQPQENDKITNQKSYMEKREDVQSPKQNDYSYLSYRQKQPLLGSLSQQKKYNPEISQYEKQNYSLGQSAVNNYKQSNYQRASFNSTNPQASQNYRYQFTNGRVTLVSEPTTKPYSTQSYQATAKYPSPQQFKFSYQTENTPQTYSSSSNYKLPQMPQGTQQSYFQQGVNNQGLNQQYVPYSQAYSTQPQLYGYPQQQFQQPHYH